LKGDAKDVKEISRQLQINKRMHFVKLIVVWYPWTLIW
jgi:hypothetical protein